MRSIKIRGTTLVVFGAVLFLVTTFTSVAFAQAPAYEERQGYLRAEVLEILDSGVRIVPGTEVENAYQQLRVHVLDGEQKGERIDFENDFIELKEGDRFFLNYLTTAEGKTLYSVRDPDRRLAVLGFVALFALVVLVFGRLQGLRSLLSLTASFLLILFGLLPQLLAGASPVPTSIGYAMLILALAMGLTHGINRTSISAFLGTLGGIISTGILAYLAVDLAALSGFVSDETVYLNLSTNGALNISGLLLGAMVIGVLGLLDDIAITQASAVGEIMRADPTLSQREVFSRALRIGKEHVGALVNTLALAYAGASLPLLLLFSLSDAPFSMLINREIIAAEILRTAIGGIGLVLTVPLSTAFAVYLLRRGNTSHPSSPHSHV